jgi:hypothetical protein
MHIFETLQIYHQVATEKGTVIYILMRIREHLHFVIYDNSVVTILICISLMLSTFSVPLPIKMQIKVNTYVKFLGQA